MISRIIHREREGAFLNAGGRPGGWGVFEPAKCSDRLMKPPVPECVTILSALTLSV
jgi:hypothetical protein